MYISNTCACAPPSSDTDSAIADRLLEEFSNSVVQVMHSTLVMLHHVACLQLGASLHHRWSCFSYIFLGKKFRLLVEKTVLRFQRNSKWATFFLISRNSKPKCAMLLPLEIAPNLTYSPLVKLDRVKMPPSGPPLPRGAFWLAAAPLDNQTIMCRFTGSWLSHEYPCTHLMARQTISKLHLVMD